MPVLAPILLFLKDNWKLVLAGLIIMSALAYVETLRLEVNHYKSETVELKREKKQATEQQKAETDRLNKEYDAVTAAHMDTLRRKGDEIQKNFSSLLTKIHNHEASKHVVIAPDVVELFNATTQSNTEAPATQQGDAGKTSPAETTLNHVLEVTAENNANHLKCIEQVKEWQQFWEDFVNAQASRPVN